MDYYCCDKNAVSYYLAKNVHFQKTYPKMVCILGNP